MNLIESSSPVRLLIFNKLISDTRQLKICVHMIEYTSNDHCNNCLSHYERFMNNVL